MKYVYDKKDIPKKEHWAALVFSRVSVDDGWGGTDSVVKIDYIVFDDQNEAVKWVAEQEEKRYGQPDPYQLIFARGVTVEKEIKITVI